MRVLGTALAAALLLAGCQTASNFAGYRSADSSYRVAPMGFVKDEINHYRIKVHLNMFKEGEYPLICGFWTAELGSGNIDMVNTWFESAHVYLDETMVAEASFLSYRSLPDDGDVSKVNAGCARSAAKWVPEFRTATLSFKGVTVRGKW